MDRKWLKEQYQENGLSQTEIAQIAGCSQETIFYWMKKLKIKARTISEAGEGRLSGMLGKHHSDETKQKMREAGLKLNLKGEKNPNWKGGRRTINDYVYILKPDHPRAYKTGYVKRARLVAEKAPG